MLNVVFSLQVVNFVEGKMKEGLTKEEALNEYRIKLESDFWEAKGKIKEADNIGTVAYNAAVLEAINSTLDTVEYIEDNNINIFNFKQEILQEMEIATQEVMLQC